MTLSKILCRPNSNYTLARIQKILATLSKILCKWKQDSVISFSLYDYISFLIIRFSFIMN